METLSEKDVFWKKNADNLTYLHLVYSIGTIILELSVLPLLSVRGDVKKKKREFWMVYKNTIKILNLCVRLTSYTNTSSKFELVNYFSISLFSKQKKNYNTKVGTTIRLLAIETAKFEKKVV